MNATCLHVSARPARQAAITVNQSTVRRWSDWTALKPDQLVSLLRLACPNTVAPLVLTALVGVRQEELAALDWSDVQPHQIQLRGTSRSAPRAVPVTPNLAEWLNSIPYKTGPITASLKLDAEMAWLGMAIGVENLLVQLRLSWGIQSGGRSGLPSVQMGSWRPHQPGGVVRCACFARGRSCLVCHHTSIPSGLSDGGSAFTSGRLGELSSPAHIPSGT